MNHDKDQSLFQFLLDLLESFMIYKKIILSVVFVMTFISIIIVQFVLKSQYDAKALVLPSSDNGSSAISKAMGKASGDMLGDLMGFSLGDVDEKDMFRSIYNSKKYQEKIILHFNLREHYDIDKDGFFMDVLKEFNNYAHFSISDEDAIELRYRSTDPALALEVIKYMLTQLDSSYNDLKMKGIKRKLQYIDNRLDEVDSLGTINKKKLIIFQQKHGIFDLEEQLTKSIETLSDFESKMQMILIEANFEKAINGANSPQYKKMIEKKKQYQIKINALQTKSNSNSVLLTLKGDPQIILDYETRIRESKVADGVYKFLRQRSEQLRVDQYTAISNLSIIDEPWVADKKSKPSKRDVVIITFSTSFVLSLSFAFLALIYKREDDNHPYMKQLNRIFKGTK